MIFGILDFCGIIFAAVVDLFRCATILRTALWVASRRFAMLVALEVEASSGSSWCAG
jgi:hypothetical protein